MKAAGAAEFGTNSTPGLIPKRWIPKSCSLVPPAPPKLCAERREIPSHGNLNLGEVSRNARIPENLRNLMLKRNKWGKIFSFFFSPLLSDKFLVLEVPLAVASPVCRNCSPSIFNCSPSIFSCSPPVFHFFGTNFAHPAVAAPSVLCFNCSESFHSLKKKKPQSFLFKVASEDFSSRHDFN